MADSTTDQGQKASQSAAWELRNIKMAKVTKEPIVCIFDETSLHTE